MAHLITRTILALLELDPKYVDVIVSRWQEFTGKAAALESDNRSYDEMRQQVSAP